MLYKLAYYMINQKNSSRSWKNLSITLFNQVILHESLKFFMVSDVRDIDPGGAEPEHASLDPASFLSEVFCIRQLSPVVSRKRWTVRKASPPDMTRGGESESARIRVIPVATIMARFISGESEIRYLIIQKSSGSQKFSDA